MTSKMTNERNYRSAAYSLGNCCEGLGAITSERLDQIFKHGYDQGHDANYHTSWELRQCAVAILLCSGELWPWNESDEGEVLWNRISEKSAKNKMAVAGAFVAAAICLEDD